jgi:Acetyltransferase (GNAT) family.
MDNNQNLKYSIGFATKEDIPGIVEAYSEWAEFSGILPDDLIRPDTAADLMPYFDGSNKSRKYLVAKAAGEILGVCYMDITYIDLQCIRLGDAIVKVKYRSKGIGTKAIEEIMKFANEHRVRKIWFWTQQELSGAIRLYENRGFVAEGRQTSQFCGKDAILYGMVITDKQEFDY